MIEDKDERDLLNKRNKFDVLATDCKQKIELKFSCCIGNARFNGMFNRCSLEG